MLAPAVLTCDLDRAMADESDRRTYTQNELAEDRTILANERTFAGWMRTSMASVAIGIGFNALFGKLEPTWVPKLIASGFLLLSVFIAIAAERRAAAVMQRLSPHVIEASAVMNFRFLAGSITAGVLGLLIALWVLL